MANEKSTSMSYTEKIYKDVTDRIMEQIMEGKLPWRQTWKPDKNGNSPFRNPYSKKTTFSFLNQLLLREPGLYATFNQIKKNGGHVLKGHKARKIFFWTTYIPKKDQAEAERLKAEGLSYSHLEQVCLRDYDMFNLEKDTEGLDLSEFLKKDEPVRKAENPTDIVDMVVRDYTVNEQVKVEETASGEPAYDAVEDKVVVPFKRCFELEEDYYASLMAGFVHSTAQQSRDDRKVELRKMKESNMSVREELIAEIGSSMILSACGLERNETHTQIAAQCQKWMEILQNDYKVLINAAPAAERSAKLVLGDMA